MRETPDRSRLPAPLDCERYRHLRRGVYDDPALDVYVNEAGDFAFLDPLPVTDYTRYSRRSQKLGLENHEKRLSEQKARLAKTEAVIERAGSFLEIGAADGGFLKLLHERFPDTVLHAIEPDTVTCESRDRLPWLNQHADLAAAAASGRVDMIGMFHVFEHIVDPAGFLSQIPLVLASRGVLLIEVPCLLDPLLSVYGCADYEDFYFQRQHPYVYTGDSLGRVLEHAGFIVEKIIQHQRYGLDNHLTWLSTGKPGGNPAFERLFGGLTRGYGGALEENGTSDTVFVVTRMRAGT